MDFTLKRPIFKDYKGEAREAETITCLGLLAPEGLAEVVSLLERGRWELRRDWVCDSKGRSLFSN